MFSRGMRASGNGSCDAMYSMLNSTDEALALRGGSLLESCVRTWIFVQNVDVDYADVVGGRNQAFKELGLTRPQDL